jgi:hypothetical protein
MKDSTIDSIINFMFEEMSFSAFVGVHVEEHDMGGECIQHDETFFEIIIDEECEDKEITLFHELIHVKQYVLEGLDVNKKIWKGIKTKSSVSYSKLPWEVEAYRLEEKYHELWKKSLTNE